MCVHETLKLSMKCVKEKNKVQDCLLLGSFKLPPSIESMSKCTVSARYYPRPRNYQTNNWTKSRSEEKQTATLDESTKIPNELGSGKT